MAKSLTIDDLKKIDKWCYFKGGPEKDGRIDKCPYNPNTKKRARNSDSSSFGDYLSAKKRAEDHALSDPKCNPGVGFHIGPLNDQIALIGIDLDGCIDPKTGQISKEAQCVIDKFNSYTEVSPSETGIKIFALASPQTVEKLRSKTCIKHKKEFKRTSHDGVELHLSNSYFTMTFKELENKDVGDGKLTKASLADLIWLVEDFGPTIKNSANAASSSVDDSGSGHGFRFAINCVKNGLTFEGFLEKVADEEGEAGDWAGRVDQRQLRRAYNRAKSIVETQTEHLVDLFPNHVEEIGVGWRPLPTEVCASELFAEDQINDFRYNATAGFWLVWNEWRWQKDIQNKVDQTIIDICKRIDRSLEKGAKSLLRKTAVQGIKVLASSHRSLVTTSEMWDSNKNSLLTPTGLVDLQSGQSTPSDPSVLISLASEIEPIPLDEFDFKQHCPHWAKFIKFICNNDQELMTFLQTWFGYCLTGQTKEQKFLFVHGCGGSGKSTFANVLTKIAGDVATQIDTDVLALSQHTRHPTSIARMKGARTVIASETKENRKWDQQLLKQLTGGDPVVARQMRQDEFQFVPQLKLTIIGNKRPSMTTVESAMKRRMLVLEMNRTPKVPDFDFMDKLNDELPGILTWSIVGAVRWYEKGLKTPSVIEGSTEEYFHDQDIFQQWFDANCKPDQNAKESFECLWNSIRLFCERKGYQSFNQNDFSDALKDRKFKSARNIGPKRGRGYRGLKLLPVEDEYDELPNVWKDLI